MRELVFFLTRVDPYICQKERRSLNFTGSFPGSLSNYFDDKQDVYFGRIISNLLIYSHENGLLLELVKLQCVVSRNCVGYQKYFS